MFDMQQLVYVFRIILAGVCGIVLGLERKKRSKEAGIRTHFVVACGAAILMLVSKYGFFDIISGDVFAGADVRLDPSRIASTIASGIGFLGAGMIFVHKHTVTGLTTAAGVWATSGIGMAIGAGMYTIGIAATLIVLIVQLVLHMNFKREKNGHVKVLVIKDVNEQGYQKYLMKEFENNKIIVNDVSVEKTDKNGNRNFTFIIDIPNDIDEDDILTLIKYKSNLKSIS